MEKNNKKKWWLKGTLFCLWLMVLRTMITIKMVKSARNYMIWQVSYFIYVLIFRFALHALIHFGVLLSLSFFLMTQCFCLIQSCCCDSLWFLLILNLTCSFYASLFATLLLCFYFSCLQLCIPLAYKIIIFLSLYFWCRLCSFVSLVVVFFFFSY